MYHELKSYGPYPNNNISFYMPKGHKISKSDEWQLEIVMFKPTESSDNLQDFSTDLRLPPWYVVECCDVAKNVGYLNFWQL